MFLLSHRFLRFLIAVVVCFIVVQIAHLPLPHTVIEGKQDAPAHLDMAYRSHNDINNRLNFSVGEFVNGLERSNRSLLVQFSSWEFEEEKVDVHRTILQNWNFWFPVIRNVLYTNDPELAQEARAHQWSAGKYVSAERCEGPPIVSYMYLDSYKVADAFFYGFTNSDIAFGNGLIDTLMFLASLPTWQEKPLLVVGRRYNFDFKATTPIDVPEEIHDRVGEATLVVRSSDFFFTNKAFPWEKMANYSIGRPLIVRAILGYAVLHDIDMVDATETIEALHLTTGDGIKSSWNRPGMDCNEAVILEEEPDLLVGMGHCECAKIETYYDADGHIRVRDREPDFNICDPTPIKDGKFPTCLLKCRERGFLPVKH